jgi:hypothetical protein
MAASETPYGDLVLLSIRSQRLINIDPTNQAVTINSPEPRVDRKDGMWLKFTVPTNSEYSLHFNSLKPR